MAPNLDVSDILTDPDFVTLNLTVKRSSQAIGPGGLAVNTPKTWPFSGVVTIADGRRLNRSPEAERITSGIMVTTRERLQTGRIVAGVAYTADQVCWLGNWYTVLDVDSYSTYGRGFVEALCALLPLEPG